MTYHDFPDFYKHPFIQSIADNPRWSVSDKNKCPIDMIELIENNRINGANPYDNDYNPCISLPDLIDFLPDASNHAYFLDAIAEKWVVMDIEPTCPDEIKQKLLNTKYLYGEISMSGKGYHLIFPLPACAINYSVAMGKPAMKEEHGYYEILISHWVTFTRNMIAPASDTADPESFDVVFEELAKQQKEVKHKEFELSETDIEKIPYFEKIVEILIRQPFYKTESDYDHDLSKYEYSYLAFLYTKMQMLIKAAPLKSHTYTDSECAWLLYTLAKDRIPYREKHETYRQGLPWLLYLSKTIIETYEPAPEKRKKGESS